MTVSERPSRGALIVGNPRSGTSLLRALLDGHPDVLAVPRESHANTWCGAEQPAEELLQRETWSELPWSEARRERFGNELASLLPGPAHPADALLAVVEGLARVEPREPRPELWVDKTPTHLRVLPPMLERLGKRTRVVCIVRDARGVLASRIRRWHRGSKRAIRHFATKWARDDALTRAVESRPEVHTVRYEDLVTDPRGTMEGVARHLELEWDDTLVRPLRDGENFGGREAFQGISASSRDRWREELTAEQAGELEGLLGPRLRARGYAVDASKVQPDPRRWVFEWRVGWALQMLRLSWLRYAARPRPSTLPPAPRPQTR